MDNNRSNSKNEFTRPKNTFQVSGSIILDNGWNIDKFIKDVETKLLSQKTNKRHKTIDSSVYNNQSKNYYDTANFPVSHKNFSNNSQNFNSTNTNYIRTMNGNSGYPLTGVNIVGKSKYNKSKINSLYPKIATKTFSRNSLDLSSDDNNAEPDVFNVPKAVRNIKKAVELARRERAKKKLLLQSKLVFDEKHLDAVFEADKLINDYNIHVKTSVCSDNNTNLFNFINKNKEISMNNVFINLLKNEKEKMKKKLNIREKNIENDLKMLEASENKFNEFKNIQKTANRTLENSLLALRLPTIRLLELRRNLMSNLKMLEDERLKLLEQIDDLRICAKFICKVFGKNNKLFRDKIIDENNENPNYETITKNAIKRFNCFLTNKPDVLSEVLNEPEIMIQKFKDIENIIIRDLNIENNVRDEIRDIQKDGEENITYIEKRYKELESDYQKLKDIYQNNLSEYNEVIKRNYYCNFGNQYNVLIRDLFSEVMDIFKPKNSKFFGVNAKNLTLDECAKETKRIITENESQLNYLISFLEKSEKENQKLFNEVLAHRKVENKDKKLNMYKKFLEDKEKEKMAQNESKQNKVLFIPRKTVSPFQRQKKTKQVKVDPKVVEQKENEQLITYE